MKTKTVKVLLVMVAFLGLFGLAPRVQAATNNFGITIDGQFSDWQDKPKTQISFEWDNFNIKEGSLLADTTNIYFYLKMSDKGSGYTDLQPADYRLKIAGKLYYITFTDLITGDVGTIKEIGISAWSPDDNKLYDLPNAKIVEARQPVGQGYSDFVEFSIPYGDLGLDSSIVNEISVEISNPNNLGSQTITTTGGSTGPFIIAGVGLVMAAGGLWVMKKKRLDKENFIK